MASSPITSWQIDGETMEIVTDFTFWGSKITADGDWSHEIKRCLLLGRKAMTNLDSILKSRDITLPAKVCLVKAMAFPVVIYGRESCTIKRLSAEELIVSNCGTGEDSWESLGSTEIKPVNTERNQPWISIGRTGAEAEVSILWPPDAKSWLIGKAPDAGKDWGQEEKGSTGDEMVGWHHWLNGYQFEQILGDSEGQGSLACYSSWGRKESDRT